ncbi:MAG: hypothetical protein Q9181_005919 [Wetmoreana brouardii]
MQTKSAILVLTFLFATLLSLASAYPQPRILAIRAGPSIGSNQRTGTSSTRTSTGAKTQTQKKKEKDRGGDDHKDDTVDLGNKSGESHGGDDSSSSDDVNGGSGHATCKVPLTQNTVKPLDAGHGCRRIAEAFQRCDEEERVFCRGPQTKLQQDCLCSKKKLYSDVLVEQCFRYLEGMHVQTASLKDYRGLCKANLV